jgi:acyl-CoA thioesterase-1
MSKLTLVIGVMVVLLVGWFIFSGDNNDVVLADIEPHETAAAAIKIIAFGDSLTAGYGLSQSQAYPAQLESVLTANGHDVEVINAGVSGETTRGNLERAVFIASQNPDIVLLGIGGNDALRSLPLGETKNNMSETIAILQQAEDPPVILLLKMQAPLNSGLAYKRDFDAIYEELADEKGLLLVPFLTAELFLDVNNKLSDGIHYNELGYQKVVEQHVGPAVREVLDRLDKRG